MKLRNFFDIQDNNFKEIFKGSIWTLISRLLATGLGLLSYVFIARYYGSDDLGVVSVVQSFLTLITVFTLLGMNTSVLSLIPEHILKFSLYSAFCVYRKLLILIVSFSIILSLLVFFVSDSVSVVLGKPHYQEYISLAAIFITFYSLMLFEINLMRSLKLIKIFAVMQILQQLLYLIILYLMFIFFNIENSPMFSYLCSVALTSILFLIFVEVYFKINISLKNCLRLISFKKIITTSFPMLMSSSMTLLIGQTGVILLAVFNSDSEVGYYSVSVKLATLASFILNSVNSIGAPKFSELYHAQKMNDLFEVAKKSTKLICYATFPIFFILIFFGKYILIFLFGLEFQDSYYPLLFLVIGQLVNSISGSTGIFMNMTGNQKLLQYIMLIAAIINVLLNIILIPQYGACGAAVSAMVSTCFWNFAVTIFVRIKYKNSLLYIPFLKYVSR